jgi:hemolysin III
LFLFVVAISFGGYLGLLWLLAPHSVWTAQVGGPFWKLLAAFLGFSLFNCFMEFFFTATSCTSRWHPS